MKKLLFMAIVATFTVVGCNKKNDENNSVSPSSTTPPTTNEPTPESPYGWGDIKLDPNPDKKRCWECYTAKVRQWNDFPNKFELYDKRDFDTCGVTAKDIVKFYTQNTYTYQDGDTLVRIETNCPYIKK